MLKKFLEDKPLYYNEIDYTRMPRVYSKIKSHFGSSKESKLDSFKKVNLVGTHVLACKVSVPLFDISKPIKTVSRFEY